LATSLISTPVNSSIGEEVALNTQDFLAWKGIMYTSINLLRMNIITSILQKLETREMEDPGSWSLPGLLSPDGSMSVTSIGWSEGQIWLHYLNGEMELLGEGFFVELLPFSLFQ
jgi:hypothetical protein